MSEHPFFNSLWEAWPKKANKHSANKAFMSFLALENDINLERLITVAKIYAATSNPNYYHDLGNWLRGDHWKDLYSMDNPEKVLERHTKNSDETDKFIKTWNDNKKQWWLPISDHASRRNIAFEAMRDPYFFDNWEEAFKICLFVFKRRFPERDYRSKITPNIEWFCRSGNVAKLIEGGYGTYKKRNIQFKDKVLNDKKTHVQIRVDEDSKEPEPLDSEIKQQLADLKRRLAGEPMEIPSIFKKK